MRFVSMLSFALFLSAAAQAKDKQAAPVRVTLKDAKGATVGTATLLDRGGAVRLKVSVKGLAPGEHGIHFHENGKCEGPDFKSAGGHLNPEHKQHGLDNPQGSHAGDLPNLKVDAKGRALATLESHGASLQPGAPNSLLRPGGAAIVIHAKPDDEKTDPAGASGDRVACGVIPAP